MMSKGVRAVREQKRKEQGGLCFYCHKYMSDDDVTLDHVIPRGRGGTGRFKNCVAACLACNNAKGGSPEFHPRPKPGWSTTALSDTREAGLPKIPVLRIEGLDE